MNAAEAAVRHQHDKIPEAMLADNRRHDVVDRLRFPSGLPAGFEVLDELRDRQAFGVGQLRPEDGRQQHFVGARKRAREIVLENAPARRGSNTAQILAFGLAARRAASVSATAVGWCAKSS